MTSDFLYENAPLIEVIAEFRWELKPIKSMPDAAIDPFFDLFREAIVAEFKTKGFSSIERLVPEDVPVEFAPGIPHERIRPGIGKWPLFQIGPGVITANIVPPYDGWAVFKAFLADILESTFRLYPWQEKALKVNRLHLRYVDGFVKSHGFKDYVSFARDMLGISYNLPNGFLEQSAKSNTDASFVLEQRFTNANPDGASGRVRLAPGTVNNQVGAVMELHCEQEFAAGTISSVKAALDWYDAAHLSLHNQFESLTTKQLRAQFGAVREVK